VVGHPWCVVAALEGWQHALRMGARRKPLLACEQMTAMPSGAVYLLGGVILLPLSPTAPMSFLGENLDRVRRVMMVTMH
jgi:hypothetical protein